MLYVKNLSLEENQTLAAMHKDHPNHVPRLRAQAVLLSASGIQAQRIVGDIRRLPANGVRLAKRLGNRRHLWLAGQATKRASA